LLKPVARYNYSWCSFEDSLFIMNGFNDDNKHLTDFWRCDLDRLRREEYDKDTFQFTKLVIQMHQFKML